MNDKYEEFKEWFKHHPTDEDELDLVFAIGNLFKEFENEQKEKEKEKQVKDIIKEVFNTVPLNEYEVEDEYFRKTIYVPNDIITEIYNKLKENDLIK